MVKKGLILITIVALGLVLCAGPVIAEEEPIKVGVTVPLTGPFASTGQTMLRAYEMAVDECNAQGGLLGRKLKLIAGDTGDASAENAIAVAERLVAANVDVVMTGFDCVTNDVVKTLARYDLPYLLGTASNIQSDTIEEGMPETSNCFDYVWEEDAYAYSLLDELFELPKKMGWSPPNKKIAILKVDFPYCIMPADLFAAEAKERGYEIVIDEVTQFGKVDWGTLLTKIERTKPAYIVLFLLIGADSARFQTQFNDRFGEKGLDALVVYQYSPSAPEFLELTGPEAAEGVIYLGGAIRENDPQIADFLDRWMAKYNEKPLNVYSLFCFDSFGIWAQAVKRAGSSENYDKVCRLMRESGYDGLFGTYVFKPNDQTAMYGEYFLPMDWMQYRNGVPLAVYPDKTKVTDYQKPPWIKN